MARVLVTGGAGYIGSHAVRALVDAGHAVAVLDNLSAGHRAAVPSGVPLVTCDMHDTARVVEALKAHRIDAVMHFAAWLDVGESVAKPLEYYGNNVTGSNEGLRVYGFGSLIVRNSASGNGTNYLIERGNAVGEIVVATAGDTFPPTDAWVNFEF